jgi:threonine/homoserine/homoserine lactone efflux protein
MNGSFPALVAFVVVMSVTPGPNNVMLAAASANYGLRAAVPQMLGIAVGAAAMMAAVGLALAAVLEVLPRTAGAVRWVGLAWLLFLAWKVANAGAPGSADARPPLGFLGAAAFQWINPKAWLLGIGGNAAFVRPDAALLPQVALVALVFLVVAIPCMLPWAALGGAARRLLTSPARLRAFNWTMAALLVASMVPMAWE